MFETSRLSPLSSRVVFTVFCVYAPAFLWVLSAFQDNINGNSTVILTAVAVCACLPLCALWLFPNAARRAFGSAAARPTQLMAILAAAASPLIAGTMVWLTLFSAVLIPDQTVGGGYPLRLGGFLVTLPAANWFTFVNWNSALQPLGKVGWKNRRLSNRAYRSKDDNSTPDDGR